MFSPFSFSTAQTRPEDPEEVPPCLALPLLPYGIGPEELRMSTCGRTAHASGGYRDGGPHRHCSAYAQPRGARNKQAKGARAFGRFLLAEALVLPGDETRAPDNRYKETSKLYADILEK
ncbi:hypothetical protein O181_055019 [Austropuccinia psidii MF-1]|uniref:Uncharacterized protein n=1 Tax=Austropuccinia psidii MF-1 TaxID=1389203 RepID=A0A9Q3HU72_9BASI|nr:hypothetical protein [Austropuccinia psidii MF-1]